MLNNIELICKLMSTDLNEQQLGKLKNVLEIVLKSTRTMLPNDELLERFKQNKTLVGLKPTSMEHYRREIRTMLRYIPDKNLCEITTADIKDYLARYSKDHNIQANTVQTMIRYISSFYDFLVNEEFIERNPTRRIERVLVEKKIKKAFTEEDLKKLRESCIDKRERAFIEFLYSTGCRISEALGLKVGNLNFNDAEVVVFGKGHKERVVYLSNICIKHVQEYFEERQAQPDEPLFSHLTKHNKNITPREAQLLLKDLGMRAGVENVHAHRFRRTFASHALDRGVPIEQIKELLGHSRIDTTMIYIDQSKTKVKSSFMEVFNKNNGDYDDIDTNSL